MSETLPHPALVSNPPKKPSPPYRAPHTFFPMLSVLESLLILQDRDVKLRKVLHDLNQLPAEEKATADRLALQTKKFADLKLRAQQIETQRRDLENQVRALREKIAKYSAQQLQTKKNDEYQALGHEIERARTEISALEDQQLERMEAYEATQKEVAAEAIHVKEFEQAAAARKADLAARQAELNKRRTELQAEIQSLESTIDPPTLARYRRILQSKGDIAIVPIEHGTTCGGCHMTLTHQTILSAKRGTSLVACENCGRLLYWVPEFA
jgi:predicted  nucleic acid-binding Zn-ribbon protein